MKKWLIKKASSFVFPLTKGNSKLKISLILIIVVETLLYIIMGKSIKLNLVLKKISSFGLMLIFFENSRTEFTL